MSGLMNDRSKDYRESSHDMATIKIVTLLDGCLIEHEVSDALLLI